MREAGLVACRPRAWVTTEQDPDADPIRDRVQRDFTAEEPGVKLVGDITYIKTWQGWLYLATVIDCCTKQVLGWSMAEHMRTDLICDALTMAATATNSPWCNLSFRPGNPIHLDPIHGCGVPLRVLG